MMDARIHTRKAKQPHFLSETTKNQTGNQTQHQTRTKHKNAQ